MPDPFLVPASMSRLPSVARLALALACLAPSVHAQVVLSGRVTDASTGGGLPAATLQVEGTTRGTVTNRDGHYELEVPAEALAGGPATVVVRFLGYTSTRVEVAPAPDRQSRDVALDPATATLGEAVVTAGNPAENIMRRVIERKARWRSGLRTWRAEVYSRQTIRSRGEIVAVIEGQTETYWDRERGLREVVRAARRTQNLGALPLDAFSAADQTLNLYDDEIPFGGFDLVGPTHPDALAFYRFTLDGSRVLDGELVYEISFTPRNRLQPGLAGSLSVLSGADAVLEVRARPSEAVQFPLVASFELTFAQQFSTFGQRVEGEAVWLPVDFRMDGQGRPGNALLRFPDLGFAISSRLTDYAVNVAVPDSLFATDEVAVDSASVARMLPAAGVVPLSVDEERALAEIDSTVSLLEAIRPTGPLARFISMSAGGESTARGAAPAGFRFRLGIEAWFNRVEAAHLGATATARLGGHRLEGRAAYQTGPKTLALGADATARLSRTAVVGARARHETVPIAPSFYAGQRLNSIATLAFGEDYFDYVRRTGGEVWAQLQRTGEGPGRGATLVAAYDGYEAVEAQTGFSLLGGSTPDPNLGVEPGEIARAALRLRLGSADAGLAGTVFSQRSLVVSGEAGSRFAPGGVGGGGYGRVEVDARWSAPTVLRRRLLPPTLHLRLAAGAALGTLPTQRAFGIDGRLAGLAPFGALRARAGRLTLASQYALLAWEHDFRSVPFEILGWRGGGPRGVSVAVHGAHAWGRVVGQPGVASFPHHEVGASVGLGYGLPVRLDVTYRLSEAPGVVVGVGLARLF